MSIRMQFTLPALLIAAAVAAPAAAQYVPRIYDKGPVTLVQEYQIAPGKLNAFMQDYAANQRRSFEIGKQVGGILGYGVSTPVIRSAGAPNLYLTITFKDLASFDRSYARADQTAIAVYGSLEKAAAAGAKRAEYGTIVSSRLLQQLTIP
jgi:hypothetical protein